MEKFVPLLLIVVNLLKISRGDLFSFSNSCRELDKSNYTDSEKLSECNDLLDDSNGKIYNNLKMLHEIYELKINVLILIIADDMNDGIKLARFLSYQSGMQRKIKRENISNDQLKIFDFLLNNIHLYENPQFPNLTFFVYPRQTSDDNLAIILANSIITMAKSVKIILTSNTTQLQIHQTFNVAGKFLRNPENYKQSIIFLAVSNKRRESINQIKNHGIHEFLEIVQTYLNIETSGRKLAKIIITKGNIIISNKLDFQKIISVLNNLKQIPMRHYDFENRQTLHLSCLFELANGELKSMLNSLEEKLTHQVIREQKTLSGILTLAEKLNNLFLFIDSVLDCTKSVNIQILNTCFQNFSNQLETNGFKEIQHIIPKSSYYLSLLCNINQRSLMILPKIDFTINPQNWIYLKNYETRRVNNWYQNLVSIFNNVHQMKKNDISESLKKLSNQLINYNFGIFENSAKIALKTIKANSIKMEATYQLERVENNVVKLQVRGKFLRLSHIMNNIQKHKILELFALEKIIIDCDLIDNSNDGLNVFIFAPIWEIVRNRSIILDGVSGNRIRGNLEQKAKNGNKITNRNGINGVAGVTGGVGGTFFGLAEKIINSDNLKLSLNGGDGSNGQDGGDAANGDDGETPTSHFLIENLNRHRCAWPRYNSFIYPIESSNNEKYYIPLIGPMIQLKYKRECYIFGLDGYPGGDGGHGGLWGKGGSAGVYKLYQLNNSNELLGLNFSMIRGKNGKGGLGGRGGRGGCTRKVTFRNLNFFDYSLMENETNECAMDGRIGFQNASTLGKKLTPGHRILQSYGETANLYKRYILEEMKNENYMELYKKVISNDKILQEYDTLTLVDEFVDLEEYYYKSVNKTSTLFFYESWKKRLDHYSTNRKFNEETDEYSEVLRSLQNTVSRKINHLKNHHFLIFLISDYLLQSQQQVQHLHNAKTVVFIKNANKKYTDEYDDKIEEAQRIIQEELQANLTQSNDELSGEIEMLLRKISRLAEMEAKNAEELVRKSQSMQEKAVIKTFNEIFSLLNTGLGIINPALATIGTKISAAGSILQNFIDDTADRNIVDVIIPSMVDKSRKFFDNWIDMKREFKKLTITENIELVRNSRMNLSARGKNVEPLEKVEKSFEELREQMERNSIKGDVITNINDEIQKEENIWQKLNRNKIYTDSLMVLKHLKTYTRMKQMLGDLVTKCQDLKNPQKIDGISNEIEKAFIKTRKLRNFKEEVFIKMLPLLKKIRDTTNTENLRSVKFLDFKNFQMQQYFNDVFNQIQFYASDFKMERYFEKTLKKMQSVVNMILSTYKRIEEYVTAMRNADYEKDLNLAPFDITYVKNSKLSMSLAKMLQKTYANIVLDDYNKWMKNFKQYIFPFADEFLEIYESFIPEVDDLIIRAQDAGERLELYGMKINRKRAELSEFQNTVMTMFGYSLPPFHIWNNYQHKIKINSLLKGEKITIHANISEHKNLNAVKFSDIWLRFDIINRNITKINELKHDLQGFAIIIEHHGDSYYRCDERIFLIKSNNHRIEKILNDEKLQLYDDNFYMKIMPIEKIKSDCILSPYATWSFQIISRDIDKNFTIFEKYKSKINIELVGLGQYSDKNLNVCQSNLGKYYENEM